MTAGRDKRGNSDRSQTREWRRRTRERTGTRTGHEQQQLAAAKAEAEEDDREMWSELRYVRYCHGCNSIDGRGQELEEVISGRLRVVVRHDDSTRVTDVTYCLHCPYFHVGTVMSRQA